MIAIIDAPDTPVKCPACKAPVRGRRVLDVMPGAGAPYDLRHIYIHVECLWDELDEEPVPFDVNRRRFEGVKRHLQETGSLF